MLRNSKMPSFQLRAFYTIAFILTVYTIYHFSTRDTNSPELVGMLNEVECFTKPTDEDHAKRNRALVEFDDYALYFICLSKDDTENKQYLRCQKEGFNKAFCGNEAELYQQYSLTSDGNTIDISLYNKDAPDIESSVTYDFSQQGFKPTGNTKTNKKQFHFSKSDLRNVEKFTFHDDFVCESKANRLNIAMCRAVLSYNSLDISISILLVGEEGKVFSEYDAKKNINHWLRLLSDIVQPIKET